MQYIKPDVATVAVGMAASMGQFLLSSGARGKRYATPHARVMMHQPSGGIGGTATDIRIHAELILHMKRFLYDTKVGDVVKVGKQVSFSPELDIPSGSFHDFIVDDEMLIVYAQKSSLRHEGPPSLSNTSYSEVRPNPPASLG